MKYKYDKKLVEQVARDKTIRKKLTRENHLWFFLVFLNSYIKNDFALFHYEIFALSEQIEKKLMVFMAFRGSGKSTIMNLSYTLWSILGKPQKKFVLIISNTGDQAKSHFSNIRRELETNKLLQSDLGPFKMNEGEWGQYTLELPSFGAKIIWASKNDVIRGLLHGSNRPDLIICDDLEDSSSVESEENRSILYDWFMAEVMTVGNKNTNIVVLGNLLHEDSLLMKIKRNIDLNPKGKIFRAYPIVDDCCSILWPQKFLWKEIDQLRKSLPRKIWGTEYALKILPKNIAILETSDKAQQLVNQLGVKTDGTLRVAIVRINAGLLDKNWVETCEDCRNRIFQKSLIKDMNIYRISSPLIIKNQYSSVSSCCLFYDMFSVGIHPDAYNFL